MIRRLIAAYGEILRLIVALWVYLVSVFRKPHTRRIASDFFAEVAVLVAVFPILDTIIESRMRIAARPDKSVYGLTWPLIALSYGIVVVCFLAAIIIGSGEAHKEG